MIWPVFHYKTWVKYFITYCSSWAIAFIWSELQVWNSCCTLQQAQLDLWLSRGSAYMAPVAHLLNRRDWPNLFSLSPWTNQLYRHLSKMPSSKKLTCKGTLRQVFFCLRPRITYPSPLLHSVNVYAVYLFTQGGGGGGGRAEPERSLEGHATVHRSGSKMTDVSLVYSINSDKHLPQSSFTDQFFLDDDIFLLVSL
jgi:hypothetical protein